MKVERYTVAMQTQTYKLHKERNKLKAMHNIIIYIYAYTIKCISNWQLTVNVNVFYNT